MLRLRDFMTRDVLSLQPSHSLREAMELFTEHHITGAPVVEQGTVVGVVTMSDVLDAASSADAGRTRVPDGWAGDGNDGEEATDVLATYFTHGWAEGDDADGDVTGWGEALAGQTVADVMTRTLAELPSHTELHEAANYMLGRGIHRVLVVDGGQLEGLVTTTDFLRLIAERKL